MFSAVDKFFERLPRQTVAPGTGQPDFSYGPIILAAVISLTVVAFLAVCLRVYVRVLMIKTVGWDDYWMVAAMTLSITGMCVVIPEVHYGAGRHAVYIANDPNLGPSAIITGLKLNFITQPIYLCAITFVKVSIGLFLLRFAPSKGFRVFIWCMQGFMCAYTVVGLVTIFTQCRPLSFLWDFSVPAVCFSSSSLRALSYANASFGISADLIFAALPMFMLRNIQVNKRVKLALFGIMSLGVFAAVASIVKASYLGSYGLTGDFLWDSVNLTIWTAAECNVGILAGSIPSLKPLFKAILQSSSYAQGYGTSRRQPHASKGYTLQRSTTGKTKSGKTQSQGSITGRAGGQDHFEMYTSTLGKASGGALVSAGARKGITAGSNSSEESILALQGPRTGGIMKTTQVEVTTMSPSKGPDDDQWKSIKEVI